ncbi:MAG: ParB N-terminal domain-containing protein [Thermoplasmata archaeon]
MTDDGIAFALLPLDRLRAHERVDPEKVRHLVRELRRTGIFVHPIWVSRGTDVILNGHHRVAALRHLGALRVPAYVVDYDSDLVRLERWTPGPPISKAEVVRRARASELFPVQTTRHRFSAELPPRPTPIAELLEPAIDPTPVAQRRRSGATRGSRSRSSPPG